MVKTFKPKEQNKHYEISLIAHSINTKGFPLVEEKIYVFRRALNLPGTWLLK